MLIKDIKYTYNDIAIVPATDSDVQHRNQCKVTYQDDMLPIFTAPMSTVVNEKNYDLFVTNKINAILPRNIDFGTRINYALNGKWAAFSLKEAEEFFCDKINVFENEDIKILIDVANGHMKQLHRITRTIKSIYGDKIKIMIGNIANPQTYLKIINCGADYVRLGIGSGLGCITSSNTATHYPMASLINETFEIKKQYAVDHCTSIDDLPKIIADGGIRNYSDVIKALALGADYVMIGGLLSALLESAAETQDMEGTIIDQFDSKWNVKERKVYYNDELTNGLMKIFYGMASKQGQKDLNGQVIKTAEGIERTLFVHHTIKGWTENMIHYLRSAMSYTNIRNVNQMKCVDTIVMSCNAFNAVNK